MVYEVLPKAGVYLAALAAMGVPVARALLTRAAGVSEPDAAAAERRLRRLALVAAIAAVVALSLRAVGHTAAAFGPAEALLPENLRIIAIESRWGGSWRWQALAAVVLLAAAIALNVTRRGWRAYALAAVVLMLSLPLLGHAASSGVRTTVHVLHLIAAGMWLGTVAAIATLPTGRDAGAPRDAVVLATVVSHFSPVALVAASIVALSGLVLAALYIASVGNLIGTAYGQTLLVKLAAVGGVAVCGRANWQRATRQAPPSRPLIALELALAVVVVAVTGVLTEQEQP